MLHLSGDAESACPATSLCPSRRARLVSQARDSSHGEKLLFPSPPPHPLGISNGRRWGFDGPVQRTGARAGSSSVCRQPGKHSGVNARGSTGPWSVVGRASVSGPALWEDGVRQACNGSCQREHQP
ncbi:hypothetical protein LI328DRAFT_135555 [Trichoderma asperelloides]|nr:hypothetical protein LI328DRAFT_135555 [Trichoderma asperelloides]